MLQSPSSRSLPAHNPFAPPPAITQVLLLARGAAAPAAVSINFVLSYSQDGEAQTEMGGVNELPLTN